MSVMGFRARRLIAFVSSEVCSQFAWEPKGSRFAMVTTNEPNAILPPGQLPKNNVDIYHIDAKKGDYRLLREYSESFRVCWY
jgi:hypothetical protein